MPARARLLLLAAAIAATGVLVAFTVARSPSEIRDLVGGDGLSAAVVFCLVTPLLSAAFFPGPLIAGASGLLFGTAAGTPISIVAATLSALLAFTISRHVGRSAVDEIAGRRVEVVREWIAQRGFVAVLYARIAPAMPFTVVNYAAGLTRLRVGVFAGATAIGVAPRAFAYTALGGSIGHFGSPESIVALVVLVVMALLGLTLFERDRRRGARGGSGLRPAEPEAGSSSPGARSAAPP